MKKIIELYSRDGKGTYLERIGDESSKKYLLHFKYYYRTSSIDDNSKYLSFVDPSGGPYMKTGDKIEGNAIKSIYRDKNSIVIEFE